MNISFGPIGYIWNFINVVIMAILENTDDASNTIATTPLDVQAAAAQATVATLLAATGNQYLNPDYLSPMPSDVRFHWYQ